MSEELKALIHPELRELFATWKVADADYRDMDGSRHCDEFADRARAAQSAFKSGAMSWKPKVCRFGEKRNAELSREVRTYQNTYICDECGKGEMKPTGMMLTSIPTILA